jgi:hypothetical protein
MYVRVSRKFAQHITYLNPFTGHIHAPLNTPRPHHQQSVLDHTTRPSVESDHARPSEMYSSNNTLNRRPRGLSMHNHSAARDEPSILPKFLRRLSARTPDSYDRAEKMMNGGNGGLGNGNGYRGAPSFVGAVSGPRGRIFKVLGVFVFLLTAVYFFLPWSPSFSSFGKLLNWLF